MVNLQTFILVALVLIRCGLSGAELVTQASGTKTWHTAPSSHTVGIAWNMKVYSDGTYLMSGSITHNPHWTSSIQFGRSTTSGLTGMSIVGDSLTETYPGHPAFSFGGTLPVGERYWGVHAYTWVDSETEPAESFLAFTRTYFQADGVTPWVDPYPGYNHSVTDTNSSSQSRWYRLIAKNAAGDAFTMDRRLLAPGESYQVTVDARGSGMVRWELWIESDGIPMYLVEAWDTPDDGNEPPEPPETPPTTPPVDITGTPPPSSGGTVTPGGSGGVPSTGGDGTVAGGPDLWNANVGGYGTTADFIDDSGGHVATAAAVTAGVAGVLGAGTVELPAVPSFSASARNYVYGTEITFPWFEEPKNIGFDVTPWASHFELLRSMLGFAMMIACAFKGAEIVRGAFAG